MIEQARDTLAADLLVVAEREVDRRRQTQGLEAGTIASAAAMNPFMSAVPRPYRRPSRSTQANGSLDQS